MRNKFEKYIDKLLPNEFVYEAQKFPYTLIHTYLPDWINLELKIMVEGKGMWCPKDRTKIITIQQTYPDWIIVMCFYDSNKTLTKKSKTKYSDWCNKHNIKWCTLETLQPTIKQLTLTRTFC
jgi:hypothetical protein